MGRSRCGLRDSCAAVETASNPMYAKKTIVAPCSTPEAPNRPKAPSFAGTNGCQFSVLTKRAANAMKSSTTVTFMNTMIVLKRADSLIPRTSSAVTASTTSTAGRFTNAPGQLEVLLLLAPEDRRADPGLRQVDAERVVEEGDHVARPADADRGRRDQVLEDEIPPDDPGDELAHRRVRVGVRAPRDGDHRRHLRVAEARRRSTRCPPTMNESATAGPALAAAARPVSTKMPVPMIAPMPSMTRSRAVSARFSPCLVCGVRPQAIHRLRGEEIAREAHCLSLTQPGAAEYTHERSRGAPAPRAAGRAASMYETVKARRGRPGRVPARTGARGSCGSGALRRRARAAAWPARRRASREASPGGSCLRGASRGRRRWLASTTSTQPDSAGASSSAVQIWSSGSRSRPQKLPPSWCQGRTVPPCALFVKSVAR